MSYKDVAAQKQADRDAKLSRWSLAADGLPPGDVLDVSDFPDRSGHLSPRELEITKSEARCIVERTATGAWTAVEVLTAFCKRTALAQQLVNCVTEVMFDQAFEEARALDDVLQKTGKTVGPLHGLPMCIKDNFKVKGFDSTVGFTRWANDPMEEESELVRILRQAGVILFVKTNISTAMMMAESYNNVWGRTLNPYNRNNTCGGSSGGEGALLALRGAPLGVGTDIGGSIRIPSSLNYLYGLKPSLGRFPTYGARSGMAGQEAVPSINGPMSPDLSSLSLFAETVIAAEPWFHDPKSLPIPWKTDVRLPKKLCFGVVYDDGVVRPQPPVIRALKETVAKLQAAGHTVIEWEPIDHDKFNERLPRLFRADGGLTIKDHIAQGDEDWPAALTGYRDAPEPLNGFEYWQLHLERSDMVKHYLERWNASKERSGTGRPMDAIITPSTPFAGVAHDQFQHVGYTCVWNITDCPAATFPVLRADSKLDPRDDSYAPRNDVDEHVWKQYDPLLNHGGPVTLQIVARKLEEEKLLEMVKLVSSLV